MGRREGSRTRPSVMVVPRSRVAKRPLSPQRVLLRRERPSAARPPSASLTRSMLSIARLNPAAPRKEVDEHHVVRRGPLAAARVAAGTCGDTSRPLLLRLRRAARRRQAVASSVLAPGLTFLEQASVRPATRYYERALVRFHVFALDNGLSVTSPPALDEALVEFMNQAFLDGERSYLGNTLLAALSFSRPGVGRPKEMPLPRAKQALRGWKRMAPAAGRLPLVWELVCGMAMHFIAVGRSALAFAMLIQTVFYLRPSELLRLRVGSVTTPNRLAGASHHRWTISMHDFVSEESTPSKTGEFDEGLQLDLPRYQFLGSVLRRLTADRDTRAPLVSLEPKELAAAMKEVAMLMRIPFKVFPYQLRHTGASTDFSTGDRLIADIKRRGRWRADQSTRRYERASQLTRLLQSIPEPALSYCLEAARVLPSVIYGRSEAVAFRGR